MKKHITLFIIGALVLFGFVGVYAFSSRHAQPTQPIVTEEHAVLPQYTKDQLIEGSDTIVLGEVKSMETVKVPSEIRKGSEDIATNVTLSIDKYLRNYSTITSNEITLQTLGGTLGNITVNVDAAASFKEGEHVLVFLKQKDATTFSVYGWEQGKYGILNGTQIGVGQDEITRFSTIFGQDYSVAGIEKEVALFKNTPPAKEKLDIEATSNVTSVSDSKDADARNAEANAILNAAASKK